MKKLFSSLKSNEGSTLVMVLVLILVLSLLGAALLSTAVFSYQTTIVDRQVKTSFFSAESGLNEAYAVIGNHIREALESGEDTVNGIDWEEFIQTERARELGDPGDPEVGIAPIEPEDSQFILEDGTVDEERLSELEYKIFLYGYPHEEIEEFDIDFFDGLPPQKGYCTYMDDMIDNGDLKEYVENPDNYYDMQTGDKGASDLTIVVEGTELFEEGDTASIELSSTYDLNGVKRKVKSRYVMKKPESTDIPVRLYVQYDSLKNIIFSKTLVAQEAVNVYGNGASIKGNVHIFGDENAPETTGLKVGNSSQRGKLILKGNLSTAGYVQTSGNESSLQIDTGDVFCNTMTTSFANNALSGNGIVVRYGDVYTDDDLELNGTRSIIEIDGSYYGFSHINDGENTQSSCIVINASTDLGKASGSSITITGKDLQRSKEYGSGIVVAGTSYIANDYQTGESISIKGNYVAYTAELGLEEAEAVGKEFTNEEKRYDKDNVLFTFIEPLTLADRYIDDNPATSEMETKKLLYNDKNTYFMLYSQLAQWFDDLYLPLNLGRDRGVNINKDRILYSTGTTIGLDGGTPSVLDNRNVNDIFQNYISETRSGTIPYFYDVQVKKLGDDTLPQETDMIDDWFDFSLIPSAIHETRNSQSIAIINPAASKSIYIVDSHSTKPDDAQAEDWNNRLEGNEFAGIILTKGDVVIDGNVDFKGVIISGKSIEFGKTGNPDVSYDHDKVLEGLDTIEALLPSAFFKIQHPYMSKEFPQIIKSTSTEYDYSTILDVDSWEQMDPFE